LVDNLFIQIYCLTKARKLDEEMIVLILSTIIHFSNIALCFEQELLNINLCSDIIACWPPFINFAADYYLNLFT